MSQIDNTQVSQREREGERERERGGERERERERERRGARRMGGCLDARGAARWLGPL